MIKALAFDIDGTICYGQNKISPFLRQVLRALENRLHIVLATGRPYEDLQAFQKKNAFYTPAVLLNGAAVAETNGRLTRCCYLPPQQAASVCKILQELDLPFVCYTQTGNIEFSCARKSYQRLMWEYLTADADIKGLLDSFIPYAEQPFSADAVFKIETVFEDLTQIEEARERLASLSGIHVVRSMAFNLEITSAQANKGAKLAEYMQAQGYRIEEVLVFGDSENDLSMFERFPHSVLVNNVAHSFSPAVESVIGPCQKDSVAHELIRRFDLDITKP